MRRGFHWYNVLEWAFILFLVLIVLGAAAEGFNEAAVTDSAMNAVALFLDIFAILLAFAAWIIGVFVAVGAPAFVALLLTGLILFRNRLPEMLVMALFLLFLIAVISP